MASPVNPGHVEDIVGLDWSDGEITAARVDVSPLGAVSLLNVGWARTGVGASDAALAGAIREVWRSAGMPSHTVAVSIRNRSVVVRPFSYPSLRSEELQAALRLEAEESLQLPREEIAVDWHLNHAPVPGVPGEGQSYSGLLVAAPLKEVEHHLSILRMAGLYPVVMDLGATAVGNLYRTMHREPKACEDACVLHLTRQSADIVMLFNGDGLYARTLHARGETWDASISTLVEGLQDALKYYVFKLRGQPVRRLVVTGHLPGQSDFLNVLQAKADVPVERWDPLAHIKPAGVRVRSRLAAGAPPPLSICMGLSLRRYSSD
ncbi:MAG TPA: pilus assembly protein PilM [Kiritimatiellia bacterium]|nr:pilus assembly protein PilM [Kiritimatiellia bacterium]